MKTIKAMKLIKQLVDQGITPYYVYSEWGRVRFGKVARNLGLKQGDFYHTSIAGMKRIGVEFFNDKVVVFN